MLVAAALAASPVPADVDLAQGIALVKEGDFERAVPRLDAAIQRLGTKGAPRDLAQAHLYLGIAYLELDQEATARGRFREALSQDPELRLEASSFSAQTIRVFEAARAEMPPRKKKGAPVLLIAGGGAAAAGIALAASGGGSSTDTTTTLGGPTTTSPAASTTTTTTTTTTTPPASSTSTTTLPAGCRFTLSPALQSFPSSGGQGTCNISTTSACGWTVESTVSWITIQGGKNGVGSGSVRFNVKKNNGSARSGRIRLTGSGDARCEISQAAAFAPVPGRVAWSSSLEIEDGRGRLSLGAETRAVGRGRTLGVSAAVRGDTLVEGVLLAGRGPGTWRFELSGAAPGSLRPLAGEVILLSAEAIVFRLEGRPGERVAFGFEAPGP
jgi:hypothetical protein